MLLGPSQGSLTQCVSTHIPSCTQSPGHKPARPPLLCCSLSPLEFRVLPWLFMFQWPGHSWAVAEAKGSAG